jgi:uncharacterized repeat protein (TIGR03803 family)
MRFILWLLILLAAGNAFGQTNLSTETVLHDFCSQINKNNNGCTDGFEPMAGLTEDASGNFYGTASYGGSYPATCPSPSGCGLVFKLDKAGNYSVLYNFCSHANCTDGETPQAGLTIDASGNLYGTTLYGGAHHTDPNNNGGGVVFRLSNTGNYTVLYSFCSQANCADGYLPYTGVITDPSGNLYGTTTGGGTYGGGTVFKLDSGGNYSVLHSFCSQANCADGWVPEAGLTLDISGNLYGTTNIGGAANAGTVYKLDSAGNFTVLYTFCSAMNCVDGANPLTSLIRDASGNFYGTTSSGGSGYGDGTVFKLDSGGKYSVLHSFCTQGNCKDGGSPRSLIEDAAGNFYGTTSGGGIYPGAGTVFWLDSVGDYSNVYYFCSQGGYQCTDGYIPIISPPIPAGNLIEDSSGNLYGMTSSGGLSGSVLGVIFELSPPILSTPNFTVTASATTVGISSPGQQGTTTITITPAGGFDQTITFSSASCSGLPTGASCTFSPSSVTPNGGAVSTKLTITTTAQSSATTHSHLRTQGVFLAFLLPTVLMLLPAKRKRRSFLQYLGAPLLLLCVLSSFGLCGCGGDGASNGGGGASGGTPAGTYMVTVTASTPNTTHTATFTLQIN